MTAVSKSRRVLQAIRDGATTLREVAAVVDEDITEHQIAAYLQQHKRAGRVVVVGTVSYPGSKAPAHCYRFVHDRFQAGRVFTPEQRAAAGEKARAAWRRRKATERRFQ